MDVERFLKDSPASARNAGEECMPEVGDDGTLAIKNRIFRKVAQRLGELGVENGEPEPPFYSEFMPDIIVIPGDQSLLFEAQNARALASLAQVCGFSLETMTLSDQIRVHPCRSDQIIDRLKAAGITVAI